MDEEQFVDLFKGASPTAGSRETDFSFLGGRSKAPGAGTIDFEVKYGVFMIGPRGNGDLQKIMSDCANGKKLLGWEKTFTTKEGDILVAIKYLVPTERKSAPEDPPEEEEY